MLDLIRDVLDNLTDGCQVIAPDGSYLYLNDAVATHARRSKEDLLGRRMVECFPGIDQTPMYRVLQTCLTERTQAELENEFEYPDGQKAWFELRFVPVSAGVCIFSRDISARKQSEDTLRHSEQMFRDLAAAAPDAILAVGFDGKIRYANPEAERIFGYEPGTLAGEPLEALLPPAARERHVASRAGFFAEPAPRRLGAGRALVALRRDGTELPVEISLSASTLDGSPVALSVIRDMTAQRKLEGQLRQAQKMEAVGRLAGGVAHDFNNLLSIIISYSDLLLAALPAADPTRADLEEVRAAGKRAAELTGQLLAFGRQQVLQPKRVSLNEVLQGIERMLRRLIGEDVELTVLLAPALGTVLVDATQLEQVILNLVVNARDAMPRGGKLTIETANVELDSAYAAEHVEASAGPHVLLAVTDTGEGMDAETRARIFEPFFTTKEVGRGTGLGLSTVFGIVRQSGGNIWVYSEPEKGTTFKLYFPRAEGPAESLAPSAPPSSRRAASETVLLVEDDARVRALCRTILSKLGYHVLEAQSAGDALLISEQHGASIHLLLTDLVMPRIGGKELAERLRAQRPTLRVLYMSGYTQNSVLHHGVLDSGVAFLQKPVTPEALAHKVREVLDSP
ncbi:MAG: PAS domain S-box protein [Polyangiaceae bacterium]|nr:PAS domain S-box protein [Polyangiaceae bacterium]